MRKCHNKDFFCDNCHNEKPSTHDDNWRPDHKMIYRARPEYCKSCHTSDFCNNRCHGCQHTADWRNDHFSTVNEKGGAFCFNCHYTNTCVECHVNTKPSVLFGEELHDGHGKDRQIEQDKINDNSKKKIAADLIWTRSFSYPFDIDVDKNEGIYITDTFKNRILKLDSGGMLITKWGGKSDRIGALHNPSEVHIDKNGDIVVTDEIVYVYDDIEHAQTLKYTSDGEFISKSAKKEVFYEMNKSLGKTTFDKEGNKYEVDTTYYCVKNIRLLGN